MSTIQSKPPIDDPQTYEVIGAAMAVHRALGCGFLEAVCRHALAIEFAYRNIAFREEVRLPIEYRGHELPVGYRVDFICYDAVVVEVKAIPVLGELERAQALNYVRALDGSRGVILNFGAPSLQHRRVVNEFVRPSLTPR